MDKANRLQTIFNICYELYKDNKPITLDNIFQKLKQLEQTIPKTTISYDLKCMKSFIMPQFSPTKPCRVWVMTQEGIEAAEKGDIFQFSLIQNQ